MDGHTFLIEQIKSINNLNNVNDSDNSKIITNISEHFNQAFENIALSIKKAPNKKLYCIDHKPQNMIVFKDPYTKKYNTVLIDLSPVYCKDESSYINIQKLTKQLQKENLLDENLSDSDINKLFITIQQLQYLYMSMDYFSIKDISEHQSFKKILIKLFTELDSNNNNFLKDLLVRLFSKNSPKWLLKSLEYLLGTRHYKGSFDLKLTFHFYTTSPNQEIYSASDDEIANNYNNVIEYFKKIYDDIVLTNNNTNRFLDKLAYNNTDNDSNGSKLEIINYENSIRTGSKRNVSKRNVFKRNVSKGNFSKMKNIDHKGSTIKKRIIQKLNNKYTKFARKEL